MSKSPSLNSLESYNFSSILVFKGAIEESNKTMTSSSNTQLNVASVNTVFANLSDTPASEIEFKNALTVFLQDTNGKLSDWVNTTIAFAGFDAVAMRKIILTKISRRRISLSVLVGLVRGNNVDRIIKTMKSQESAKEFQSTVRALDIKRNVAGNYNAITLSRLIVCFPEVVCNFLYMKELPMAIQFSELQAIHSEYPLVSRHQVCASIIPHTVGEENLNKILDVLLVPYLKVSEVINSKVKDWQKMTVTSKAETSSMYLHNSYNSKVLRLEDRESLSRKFRIITNDNKLSSTWGVVAQAAQEWLKKHYNFCHSDPYSFQVITK